MMWIYYVKPVLLSIDVRAYRDISIFLSLDGRGLR
jgi:hypothetical protein